jgi:hypothetical protein
MEIDPIVLMAYVSVSINIITMIAACTAYAMFHVRRRRRRRQPEPAARSAQGPVAPLFLRPCRTLEAVAAPRAAPSVTAGQPQAAAAPTIGALGEAAASELSEA